MAKGKWKVSVDGTEELYRRLKAVLTIVRREVGIINRDAALKGLDRARVLASGFARTGEYLQSMDIKGGGTVWRFGSYGLEYPGQKTFRPIAKFIEYGTARTPAHPVIWPSQEAVRSFMPQETRRFARALPFMVRAE